MKKPRIGITIGDINGIGLEVIIKTLANPLILKQITPIVYGSGRVFAYHRNIVKTDQLPIRSLRPGGHFQDDKINLVNCWEETASIQLGELTEEGGKYAWQSLQQAIQDLRQGHIDALTTAPIHKKAMQMAGFHYAGHTEYLAKELGGESLMMMVSDRMKLGLATHHIPLKEVPAALSKGLIIRKLRIMEQSLRQDFGLEKPLIAVLGLNPHAGDDGLMGNEESEFIRPAILELKKKNMLVMGPFPADSFFGSGQYAKFDGILAMYHDQGLIPFKTLSFGEGVNFTAGLKFIRTSPDHGTAMDIAGKNQANPASFRRALFLAADLVRQRQMTEENAEETAEHKPEREESTPET